MKPDLGTADATTTGYGITKKQATDAALVLAGHATSPAELRDWLETCGILPCDRETG